VYVAQRASRGTDDGLKIPIDWQSVTVGWGRVWLPILAVALPLVPLVLGHFQPLTLIATAVFAALAVLAYRSGNLNDETKARLRLLGTVTGLRIDPAKLRPETREVKRDSLGELMGKAGIPLTAEMLIGILDEIPVPALPLVYGYARYAGDDAAWQTCAALIYERYQQSEV
jgi:hypothetical protein